MDNLKKSNSNHDRINLFSASGDQSAFFGGDGQLSFSQFFWSNTAVGKDVRTAFRTAEVAIRAATQNGDKTYQDALLDDTADGQNDFVDGSLARDTFLGDVDDNYIYPIVTSSQGSQTVDLNNNANVNLFAKVDVPHAAIERVWAIVIPPDNKTTGSEAITELPVIELTYDGSEKYTASTDIFSQNGRYTLSYYAKTKSGTFSGKTYNGTTSRFPLVSLITTTNTAFTKVSSQDTRVVIVAGGSDANDELYKSATYNANLAYLTLRHRGINSSNITYLNFKTQTVGGETISATAPTKDSILAALTNWYGSLDAKIPLLVYFTGAGAENTFYPSGANNAATNVTAGDISGWFNTIQDDKSSRVTFIYDAAYSGSFMDELSTNTYERTNLFSTKAGDGAYFGSEGQLSFSHFFWINTSRGMDVKQAYRESLMAMQTATRGLALNYKVIRQRALLDDNGDKLATKTDGALAKNVQFGINAATASVFPVVFYHEETLVKNNPGDM